MKKILGLDLGVASIGWALVNQAENEGEKSSIIKTGVRVVPLSANEANNFEAGRPCETNAERRKYRSMRRNLQRYKLRRSNLKEILKETAWIDEKTILAEQSNASTFETYRLRAQAATGPVSLEEFARILLMINKKRGYKSNRKANNPEDGTATDGMEVAKELYASGLTPGEYGLKILKSGKKYIPEFFRSDLQAELDKIWEVQKAYYPEILTDDFKNIIAGRGKNDISKIFLARYGIYTADNKGKSKNLQEYQWRVDALTNRLEKDVLAYVIAGLSGTIKNSSGYLGEISDRSKELFFSKKTVGQYLYEHIKADPHFSTKNIVFYRADYIDEFEKLWEEQSKHHPELTPELKKKIKEEIIFYQRRLKSQKGLIGFCEFESKQVKVIVDGKEKSVLRGPRVAPRSSLIFQEFKKWQILNNLELTDKETGEQWELSIEEKKLLSDELNTRDKMTAADAIKFLYNKQSGGKTLNYKTLEGNTTYAAFLRKFMEIVNILESTEYDINKMRSEDALLLIRNIFKKNKFNTDILNFDPLLQKEELEQQALFKLWHLLYSFEGDDSRTGDESLVKHIQEICNMPKQFARMISTISFTDDYGSLSNKAMRNILPFLMEGNKYSVACSLAGYNHSKHSMTKEQIENKELVNRLEILPKGSLRNPVVEKILNQMINVVNALRDEYGKPDEIHIEFARQLKMDQKSRESYTESINQNEKNNARIRQILNEKFNIQNVRSSDILRYKLWEELKDNGYKALYSNRYIPAEKIFSNETDIDHIIPQAVYFDDSFKNKTLEYKDINLKKGKSTARDFVESEFGPEGLEQYLDRVNSLSKSGVISKTKNKYLLMRNSEIPDDFLNRDLSNSQYIAKKATEILESYVKTVMPTTGSITARLREDWQLVNVMKEINLPKYREVGLTYKEDRGESGEVEKIEDWSKRDDHRHHAMDAITIAFTKLSHIQYLNNLNARSDKSSAIYGIEKNETILNANGKRIFTPSMPLNELRAEFRNQLNSALVSVKAKNKVVTRNVNKTKKKNGYNTAIELTPRGQIHKEQVYGVRNVYETFYVPVGGKLDKDAIAQVASKREREALNKRLTEFGGDPKKAFTGKNAPDKNPIWLDEAHSASIDAKVKCVRMKRVFSIRKDIDKNLSIEKVMDTRIRKILKERLEEFEGDASKAFANLDENPIWLNKEKGICIKKVTIQENFDLDAIREKHDMLGNPILDESGNPIASDYVNLRNNHHVAIYQKPNGDYEEDVVSFFEALERVTNNDPVVDKAYNKADGWEFLFSMKINEMFVFPNPKTGFDPKEIDLMDEKNYSTISPNLYRVQNLSNKYYVFRLHTDTDTKYPNVLKNITWKRITNLPEMAKAVKVRVDHTGKIVAVGEYD